MHGARSTRWNVARVKMAAVLGAALWLGACAEAPETTDGDTAATQKPRVILIGLDGASWNVLDPMIEAGELPNLAGLVERGASARLATVEPVISPTVWTSIATGRRPEIHGVTSFFATSQHLRWPTVWQRLARKDLRVGLYNFLVTWPPMELTGGFVIPGWLRRDAAVTPPDVFDRAGVEPYSYELSIDSPEAVRDTVDREVSLKAGRFNALRQAFDLDLGVVSFYSIDLVSHRFWHDYRPRDFEGDMPPVDPEDRGILRRTMIRVDQAVGDVVGAAGPDTTILLASDHGFLAHDRVFRQWTFRDRLLELAGIDSERDGIEIRTRFQQLQLSFAKGEEAERDKLLSRLEAFFASVKDDAGRNLLFIDAFHVPVRPEESKPRRPQWLVDLAMTEEDSTFAFLSVLPKRHVLIQLSSDAVVTAGTEKLGLAEILYGEPLSGDHDPEGVMIAAGPGIRRSAERGDASVLDLAPLFFYLLGEAIPEDLEGTLPVNLLEPKLLRGRPPERTTSELTALDALATPSEEDETAKPENEELVRRLRSLGYLN